MFRWDREARRVMAVTAAALLSVVVGSLGVQRAGAVTTYCRSDPVVTLSNGATLDLSASIGDSLSDVQKVVYVVHAPSGTRVLAIVNTDGLMGLKESVQFYANDTAGTYDTSTTVYTGHSKISVTATTDVISALGLTLGLKSASGVSGTAVLIHISSLL
jgi:hypothetical protein